MNIAAVRFIEPPEPNGRLVAVEIDGHFSAADKRAFIERLGEITGRGEKALVYQDMQGDLGAALGLAGAKRGARQGDVHWWRFDHLDPVSAFGARFETPTAREEPGQFTGFSQHGDPLQHG